MGIGNFLNTCSMEEKKSVSIWIGIKQKDPGFVSDFVERGSPSFAYSVARGDFQ